MDADWKQHIARLENDARGLTAAIKLAVDENDAIHADQLRARLSSVESQLLTIRRQDRERRAGLPVQMPGAR